MMKVSAVRDAKTEGLPVQAAPERPSKLSRMKQREEKLVKDDKHEPFLNAYLAAIKRQKERSAALNAEIDAFCQGKQ